MRAGAWRRAAAATSQRRVAARRARRGRAAARCCRTSVPDTRLGARASSARCPRSGWPASRSGSRRRRSRTTCRRCAIDRGDGDGGGRRGARRARRDARPRMAAHVDDRGWLRDEPLLWQAHKFVWREAGPDAYREADRQHARAAAVGRALREVRAATSPSAPRNGASRSTATAPCARCGTRCPRRGRAPRSRATPRWRSRSARSRERFALDPAALKLVGADEKARPARTRLVVHVRRSRASTSARAAEARATVVRSPATRSRATGGSSRCPRSGSAPSASATAGCRSSRCRSRRCCGARRAGGARHGDGQLDAPPLRPARADRRRNHRVRR